VADVSNLTLLAAFESDRPLSEADLRASVAKRAPGEPGLGERIAQSLTYWTHEGLLERADPRSEDIHVPRARRDEARARLVKAGLA
jgi:hypothetical protein